MTFAGNHFFWLAQVFFGSLLWASSLTANPSVCGFIFTPIRFDESYFASSTFGLIHSDRPGKSQFSNWSANAANQILISILLGKDPKQLFEEGVKARQFFANKYEGIENPETDFGADRESRSPHLVGEDIIGVSSVTLTLQKAKRLPKKFNAFPNRWWKKFANQNSRTDWADSIIQELRRSEPIIQDLDRDLLIVDRHYVASTGEVIKATSVKFQRAIPGKKDSAIFVSTWNAPKSEIDLIKSDVYRQIQMAMKATDKEEAKFLLGNAMYGFFVAMPYYRGSAAIGRIVFTALFSIVLGGPIAIHPECDVKALASTQYEYLQNLDSILERVVP